MLSKAVNPRRKVHKLSQAGRWKEAIALADSEDSPSEGLLKEAVDGVAHRLMQVLKFCTSLRHVLAYAQTCMCTSSIDEVASSSCPCF